jgi:myo-inositol 2-dehydrogenase/D-chiro-inositol 1-dehydrogenase
LRGSERAERSPPRNPSRLAVGLVGVGRIGLEHAKTLRSLDGVTLTIADANRARARSVADELGVETAESPEALFESGIDAVAIATATPAHAPLLGLAAQHGVPAFCEKPVALDLETMDDVIAEVEAAGILVQVGFQRRFDVAYRALHDAVADGSAGRILVMHAATHDPYPPPREYIAASGGIFRDLHIHDFDAIRFVSGEEIVEVYAAGAALEVLWFADYGDVDTAAALLQLESGALVIVSGTRHDPAGYDVRLEVFGTKRTMSAGLGLRAYTDFWDRFEPAYRAELEAFVSSVRDGGDSACPLAEARSALAVALAAEQSRQEGLAKRPLVG